MNFPNEFIPVMGPVLAALIAASAAFLASVLSKELKTSEFRQAWIDQVRNDLADFVGLYRLLTDMAQSARHEEGGLSKWAKSVKSEILHLESAKIRIELRLNPEKHRALISKIDVLTSHDVLHGADEPRDEVLEALVSESQAMLKLEWERVKRGEGTYKFTKWASFAMAIVLIAAAVTLATIYLS